MAVPEDIRRVPRPVNTVVDDSGCNGPKRYAVRVRSRVKYVRGGNPQPSNGDLERMEPACAQVFPGDCIDASCYPDFIRDNDIRRGVIVADKGFPPSKIKAELDERPDLHFLTPIKRNNVRIATNGMLAFQGVLNGVDGKVLYKKASIKCGRYLYSFKDLRTAAKEEADYVSRTKEGHALDSEKYEEKRRTFGVLVLESDQKLKPQTVYRCYEERWMIELVFRHYKNDEFLDKTGVQSDFSVIGNEFVNHLSTTLSCRIVRKARQCGLLDKMSYGELMEDLATAWRRTDAPEQAHTDDGYWVHSNKGVFEELEALGLSIPAPKTEPKKRGLKPKPQTQAHGGASRREKTTARPPQKERLTCAKASVSPRNWESCIQSSS